MKTETEDQGGPEAEVAIQAQEQAEISAASAEADEAEAAAQQIAADKADKEADEAEAAAQQIADEAAAKAAAEADEAAKAHQAAADKADKEAATADKKAATEKAKAPKYPESITLAAPYGFIDEDGSPKHWPAGMVVTDPDDIKTLVERDALIVGHPDATPAPTAA